MIRVGEHPSPTARSWAFYAVRRCPLQTYETLFITSPELTEDDEKSTVEFLSKIVTEGGGAFHANERMGRKRLGYPDPQV